MSLYSDERRRLKLRREAPVSSTELMRCERLRCTLTVDSCAQRYTRAQTLSIYTEQMGACRYCPIGKGNAS